jgi:hypothetical protein
MATTADTLVSEQLWQAIQPLLRVRYDRSSERFFAFAMLACDRLYYNRLPCAATARLP